MKRACGIVRKKTIVLDAPVPELEGCRMDVELTPVDDVAPEGVTPAVLQAAWADWASRPDDGPIRPVADWG